MDTILRVQPLSFNAVTSLSSPAPARRGGQYITLGYIFTIAHMHNRFNGDGGIAVYFIYKIESQKAEKIDAVYNSRNFYTCVCIRYG